MDNQKKEKTLPVVAIKGAQIHFLRKRCAKIKNQNLKTLHP